MLTEAATAFTELKEQLIEAIETETAVKLFAARNMPQASETQRAERQTAIQFALRARADVPLEVMRLCATALRHAETVAERSSRAASSDVELAVALLRAAFDGARTNLEMKLSSLTDPSYIGAVVDEIAHLADQAAASAQLAESSARRPSA